MKQTNASGLLRVSETELSTLLIALSSLLKVPKEDLYKMIADDCDQAWRDRYVVVPAMARLKTQIETILRTT